MSKYIDDIDMTFAPDEFKLVKKAVKKYHKKHTNGKLNNQLTSISYKFETSKQRYKKQAKIQDSDTEYRIEVTNDKSMSKFTTYNVFLVSQFQKSILEDCTKKPTHINSAELGVAIVNWVKQVADNQTFYNPDNIVGTVDDILDNNDTNWRALTIRNEDGQYHYATTLASIIDFIKSVYATPTSDIRMHNPRISDQEYYYFLLFLDQAVLPFVNDNDLKFEIRNRPRAPKN